MRFQIPIIIALCLSAMPARAFAKPELRPTPDKAICEQIWNADHGFMHVRQIAYRILELNPYAVQDTLNFIQLHNRRHFGQESEISQVDIYDGLHRILWEELLARHLSGLPSPRVQKNLLFHAKRRVAEVMGKD